MTQQPSPSRAGRTAGPLVQVQHGTGDPAVYCFHPLSGSVAVYGPLAARIGREQLTFGVQAIGLVGGHEPDRTVEAMARRYAEAIAAASPTGAVFLGYSLGGVLAMETARLLTGLLTGPVHVVLVDCDPLYSSSAGDPWQILVHQTLNIDLPVAELHGLAVEQALAVVREAGARQGRIPARMSLDRLAVLLEVCRANESAAARHVPLPFPGTVHVIRSKGAVPAGDVWHAFADRAVISVVAVDHHDIMGASGVAAVADAVRPLLSVT